MNMKEEIDAEEFAAHRTRLRDEEARLRLKATSEDREKSRDVAARASELTQRLAKRWVRSDYAAKRRVLRKL